MRGLITFLLSLCDQFFVAGTFLAFNIAAVYTDADTEYWQNALNGTKWFGAAAVSSDDIRRAKHFDLAKVRTPAKVRHVSGLMLIFLL